MNLARSVQNSARTVNISTFGLACLWFPLSILYLAQSWSHHSGFEFYFWLISTLLFFAFWPLGMVTLMGQLRISRLWSTVVFLPVALLVLALTENWKILTLAMVAVGMAAPWPFLLLNLRGGSAPASQTTPRN
jgi:hypothetical protein